MDRSLYPSDRFGQVRRTPGRHGYLAYFPRPIPRDLPIPAETARLVGEAEAALGRLAGAGRLLPNPHLLTRLYLPREAVASTRIEGTQASLPELFELEALGGTVGPDLEEVVNYVEAMETGLTRLADLPLSTRLLNEMHGVLLRGVRGRERAPGELRRSQNWIGEPGATIESAIFVPPPPDEIGALLADWERFANEESTLPLLVQCGLLHWQFETIHPYLDGNGRLGRLVIVLFLVARRRLPAPILYLSAYFDAHRSDYYRLLQSARQDGAVDGWLQFFLRGIETQANDALTRAERLVDLRERYRALVLASTRSRAAELVELALEAPIMTTRFVEGRLGVTRPTALSLLRQLDELGILARDRPGPRGQMVYVAREIMAVVTDDDRSKPRP